MAGDGLSSLGFDFSAHISGIGGHAMDCYLPLPYKKVEKQKFNSVPQVRPPGAAPGAPWVGDLFC